MELDHARAGSFHHDLEHLPPLVRAMHSFPIMLSSSFPVGGEQVGCAIGGTDDVDLVSILNELALD